MKHLIRFLLVITAAATLLAGLYFIWNYREYYSDHYRVSAPVEGISAILTKYDLAAMAPDGLERLAKPKLPDLSAYSVNAIRNMIPGIAPGLVRIENLETGYAKLRMQLALFGDKQDRLDPLSIVISKGVYDLPALVKDVADDRLITRREDGVYVLYVPLSIRSEGALVIKDNDVLLLSSKTGALISSFGKLYIIGAEVAGWNTQDNQPAYFTAAEEFRPYITTWCGSVTHIASSKISHLGYGAAQSYGIFYSSCRNAIYREDYPDIAGGTGWIIENEFTDNYFGFYSYDAEDIVILGNIYDKNIVYGIDPHDHSKNLIIAYNTTKNTKEKHGIIISRDVSDSFIFKNLAEENAGSGIMIDRNSTNNIIAYNISRRNQGDGLTFYESGHNISYGNTLIYNKKNGLRIRNSQNIHSQEDIINHNELAGIDMYSIDLMAVKGAKHRNLKLDPYVQKTSVTMIDVEMIGNREAQFKLDNIDDFKLLAPHLYRSPENIFAGEIKGIDELYMKAGAGQKFGFEIKKKEALH